MAFLEPEDLSPFATIDLVKAQAMIDDAEAIAVLAAPCLAEPSDLDPTQVAAIRAVLRGAILRWNDAGSGAVTQQTAGPFSQTVDNRAQRRGMFWPTEIEQLQDLCQGAESTGAYAIDTVCNPNIIHADICSLRFGGEYCSCGAVLTGLFPLYELP
jgi:hypothetical protein